MEADDLTPLLRRNHPPIDQEADILSVGRVNGI